MDFETSPRPRHTIHSAGLAVMRGEVEAMPRLIRVLRDTAVGIDNVQRMPPGLCIVIENVRRSAWEVYGMLNRLKIDFAPAPAEYVRGFTVQQHIDELYRFATLLERRGEGHAVAGVKPNIVFDEIGTAVPDEPPRVERSSSDFKETQIAVADEPPQGEQPSGKPGDAEHVGSQVWMTKQRIYATPESIPAKLNPPDPPSGNPGNMVYFGGRVRVAKLTKTIVVDNQNCRIAHPKVFALICVLIEAEGSQLSSKDMKERAKFAGRIDVLLQKHAKEFKLKYIQSQSGNCGGYSFRMKGS